MTAQAVETPAAVAPRRSRRTVRTGPLLAPSVGALVVWMIVPLAMTLWFSFQRYNLLNPAITGFAGVRNYKYLFQNPVLWIAIWHTIQLVGSVLILTVVFGVLFAIIFDEEFFGRNIARLLVIAPFFVMPTVSALIWKNLLMDPVNGLLAHASKAVGLSPVQWMADFPLLSIIIIVAWQWIPFATLILMTAMQSLDREQMEAARMDGAKGPTMFFYIVLPHLYRPLSVVIMIETIFLLSIYAEIAVTTNGGPGTASTNLTYVIAKIALIDSNIGGGSAAGVVAIVLANIVAAFLIRTVARNLDN